MKKAFSLVLSLIFLSASVLPCHAVSKRELRIAEIENEQKALTGDFILFGGLTLAGAVSVALAAVMFGPGKYYDYSDYSYHYTDGEPALFWPLMIGGGIACIAAVYVGATAVQKYTSLEKEKDNLTFGFSPAFFPEITNSGYAPGMLLTIKY